MAQFLTVSPETSKKGRSRFSKALPSVPGLLARDPKQLPLLPSLPASPRPPKPPARDKEETDDRSVRTVKSTISRKPVGVVDFTRSPPPPPPPPPPKPQALSADAPPKAEDDDGVAAAPPLLLGTLQASAKPLRHAGLPSSTDSLSSLLSAYSRVPDEPVSGGSAGTGTASTSMCSASETSLSPLPLGGSLSEWAAAAPKTQPTTPPYDAKLLPPPPPPPAPPPPPPPAHDDDQHDANTLPQPQQPPPPHHTHHQKQLPPSPPSDPPRPDLRPDPAKPSSPQPEIWRRRSVKADTNRAELSGLRLNHSHGSTASTPPTQAGPDDAADRQQQQQQQQPLFSSSPPLPPLPPPLPPPPTQLSQSPSPSPSPVVGLPGRNVRPAAKQQLQQGSPPRQHPPPSDTQAMGHASSSLSQFKNVLCRKRSSVDGATTKKTSRTPQQGAQRPPTPEYHKEDVKTAPPVDVVVSPISPAPSESPTLAQTGRCPKTAPIQGPSGRSDRAPIPRKSLPSAAPSLPGAANLQNLRDAVPSPASGQPLSARQPPVNLAGPGRQSESSPRSPLSATPDAPPSAADRCPSEPPGPQYRGKDGTLYVDMRVTREPDPKATYFPVQTDKPLAPGTIISARPPKDSHFNCYQNHKTMNRRPNRNCPLTCQTCDKADAEDRWVCPFCHLRICDSCMRVLNGHQRVLRRLVDELAVNTPLSLSSMSRPGSALGLQAGKSP